MTIVAIITTDYMVCVLTARNYPVMAGSATAKDIAVIDIEHGRETVGCMTVLAGIGGRYVGRVFAGRIAAVVAGDTIADDVGVIENSG